MTVSPEHFCNVISTFCEYSHGHFETQGPDPCRPQVRIRWCSSRGDVFFAPAKREPLAVPVCCLYLRSLSQSPIDIQWHQLIDQVRPWLLAVPVPYLFRKHKGAAVKQVQQRQLRRWKYDRFYCRDTVQRKTCGTIQMRHQDIAFCTTVCTCLADRKGLRTNCIRNT